MMSPDQHQQAAERLLSEAEGTNGATAQALVVARAHVHAMLASRAPWTVAREPEPFAGVLEEERRPVDYEPQSRVFDHKPKPYEPGDDET